MHSFTQDDIASRVFVTRQAVSKWEKGDCTPDIDTLIALSQLYCVTVDDMLKIDLSNAKLQNGDIQNQQDLKSNRKRTLAKTMCFWAFALLGVYALVCGIIQVAFVNMTNDIWLVWFTLPIVPPIVFAIRFFNEIGKKYILFFVDMPFVSGLIFQIIVLCGNKEGAWISFLLIPVHYCIAVFVAIYFGKQEKLRQKASHNNHIE